MQSLNELTLTIEGVDLLDFFGPANTRFGQIKNLFPKLRIAARGQEIKAYGDEDQLKLFEKRINSLKDHYEQFGTIKDADLNALELAPSAEQEAMVDKGGSEVLVYGPNGLVVKARTKNQRAMVAAIKRNDIVFAVGPAGTGKSYTAVALAIRALKNKEVKKIILTRPAVEAGENLGFLPGDLKEKIDPYLRPLYDALNDMLPPAKLEQYLETDVIEIAPLAFMRGRTLDNAFVILDEAQNTTEMQIKMFLTRMGPTAKFLITGDLTQIDLPRNQRSGLVQALRLLKNIQGLNVVQLTAEDVVRHRLVKDILNAYTRDQEVLPIPEAPDTPPVE